MYKNESSKHLRINLIEQNLKNDWIKFDLLNSIVLQKNRKLKYELKFIKTITPLK